MAVPCIADEYCLWMRSSDVESCTHHLIMALHHILPVMIHDYKSHAISKNVTCFNIASKILCFTVLHSPLLNNADATKE